MISPAALVAVADQPLWPSALVLKGSLVRKGECESFTVATGLQLSCPHFQLLTSTPSILTERFERACRSLHDDLADFLDHPRQHKQQAEHRWTTQLCFCLVRWACELCDGPVDLVRRSRHCAVVVYMGTRLSRPSRRVSWPLSVFSIYRDPPANDWDNYM